MAYPNWNYGSVKTVAVSQHRFDALRDFCLHSQDSSNIKLGTVNKQIPAGGPGTARAF